MKNRKDRILAVGLAILVVVSLLAGTSILMAAKTDVSQSKVMMGIGKSKTIKMKNTGKKVSVKILSGKRNISIKKGKKNIKITGKKEGKARLSVRTGNETIVYQVIVTKDEENGSMITVESSEYTITYQLNNSQAAEELYNQLPLILEVENYSDNEKIFYPPEELKTSDTPKSNGSTGSLSYYAPWNDVVMFYEDASAASGLYELGTVVSGEEYISKLSGEITVSKAD